MSNRPDRPAIGIGLIGLGWMGKLHARAYCRVPQHFRGPTPRLIIAADDDERARREGSTYGFAELTADWRAVVEHPDVNAVSIAAPNFVHRDAALAAAAVGKHVWVEKPVGRNADETGEIAAAIADARVRSMVGFDLRFVPAIARAAELLHRGELGEVHLARASFLTDYAADPASPHDWHFSRDRAGSGALGDLMSHVVDLLGSLVAPIAEVCAAPSTVITSRPLARHAQSSSSVENDDQVATLLKFENGALGVAEVSRIATGHQSDIALELLTTKASLRWSFARMNDLVIADARRRGFAQIPIDNNAGELAAFQPGPGLPMGYDDLKVIQARDFLASIESGIDREPGVTAALRAASVLAAMERSFGSRGWERAGKPDPTKGMLL